jgi:hypothetical protein
VVELVFGGEVRGELLDLNVEDLLVWVEGGDFLTDAGRQDPRGYVCVRAGVELARLELPRGVQRGGRDVVGEDVSEFYEGE